MVKDEELRSLCGKEDTESKNYATIAIPTEREISCTRRSGTSWAKNSVDGAGAERSGSDSTQ